MKCVNIKKVPYLKFFILVFFVLLHSHLIAQKNNYQLGLTPNKDVSQYVIDVWQKTQGLKQNTIYSVIQSQNGYLWLASSEGLIRFDGKNFKLFNSSNIALLNTSSILEVFEDSEHRLWIGTNGAGLLKYEQGKFTQLTMKDGLPSNIVQDITEDKNNVLWLATTRGLASLKNQKVQKYGVREGLPSANITDFHVAKDGELWIGTSRGIASYRNNKIIDHSRNLLLIDRFVTNMAEDHLGHLWIGTHGGLVRWDKKKKMDSFFKTEEGLKDDYITKLFIDHYGTLWIGTQSAGLYRLTKYELTQEKPPFKAITTQDGLTANSILDIYEDYEGSLWLGLNRGGLNRLRQGKFDNYTQKQGLNDDFVNCIFQDKKGIIWIGTLSGGLSSFENGKIKHYTSEDGLPSNHIRSITEDKKGNLWLGTYGAGIVKYDKEKSFQNINTKNGLAGDIVRCMIQAKDQSFWIATKTGLSHYKNEKFKNYSIRNGLSSDAISLVFEDRKGNIWVGTEGHGLDVLKDGKVKKHYNTNKNFFNNTILSIYEDIKGRIWVGTKAGLSIIINDKVQTLTIKQGLASEAIHSIMEDGQEKMWFSSNNGVYWINKKAIIAVLDGEKTELQSYLFQEEDGMRSSDCALMAYPTVLKDKKGALWYPTSIGVVSINPQNIASNPLPPKVLITNIMVDGKEFFRQPKLSFPAGTNRIEFDFAGFSFIAPNKVKYKYKLEGFEKEWIDFGHKRRIFYTNLPPGNYTFRVIASNNDGVWNEVGDSQSFYIHPYFYQTRLFFAFIILLLLSMVVGIYYWRTANLRKRAKYLEQKVTERTLEIREKANELATIDRIVRVINKEFEIKKVLSTILEQSLNLFSATKTGLFFDFINRKQRFEVLASIGYEADIYEKIFFFPNDIINYYKNGKEIAKDLYLIRPKEDNLELIPNYQPSSSLVMSIKVNDRVEGIMFLDSLEGTFEINEKDLRQLRRLKQHAISAFTKAQILSEIEQKNVEIANNLRKVSDSIKYAHRIQKAILGNPEHITQYFEDGFIYYVPKDIVSGDFYWFIETEPQPIFKEQIISKEKGVERIMDGFTNIKEVLVVADCTGHGVPGGFMTVIGHDLLDRIVKEQNITDPAQILYELDTGIKEYLRQDQEQHSNEGMDLTLLVIDRDDRTVEFAGAKNPMIRIREGEMTVTKGSKFPIGGTQIKNKHFEKHSFDYQEGDIYYLFTDGFQDQFGGENNRKFSPKRLREVLSENHTSSMKSQKSVLRRTLRNWIQEGKQTDDILIIGIKF